MPVAGRTGLASIAGSVATRRPLLVNTWLKAALVLAAVWLVAGGGIWWLHATRPTAQ